MNNARQKILYLILALAPLFFRIGSAFGNDSIHYGKTPWWKVYWPPIKENWQLVLGVTIGGLWAVVILIFAWIGYRNRNISSEIK